jgi:hypothetical protein
MRLFFVRDGGNVKIAASASISCQVMPASRRGAAP